MDTIEELNQIRDFQSSLPKMRAELVAKAREEGKTWRVIADALGMTQTAIINADKTHRAAGHKPK